MTRDPFDWIDAHAERRRAAGLVRTLRPRPASSPLLDLASNDYLGLAHHPEVTRAGADACLRWGAGSTGSRLVTGSTELHAELEAELAAFCGFEAALVLASGYAANLAAVTALTTEPGTLIVSDSGNHASLIDGCRLSRAGTEVVPHADTDALRKALGGHDGPAVAVTDSVFSVDGDAAPLRALAAACAEHGAALLVDDAHGLGVLGPGGRGRPRRRVWRASPDWCAPPPSPSPWAARAAWCSARPGSSSTWSTPRGRSSSTRASPRRRRARHSARCAC